MTLASVVPFAIGVDMTAEHIEIWSGRNPIEVDGVRFDADEVSRNRITNMVVRLPVTGLPAEWLGWRDADNLMHWADDTAEDVANSLIALKSAIEDREQALLSAAWQHKAAILATENAEALTHYDIDDNRPA